MVIVRQRSADFFVRYAIVEADRQGVTGPYTYMSNSPRNEKLKRSVRRYNFF